MVKRTSRLVADWCIVEMDDAIFRAKIIHVGRGKYKIEQDNRDGNFVGQILDASNVLQCDT